MVSEKVIEQVITKILKTLINKYLNKCKKNLYVCFVDFKKAFDSVVRKALMYKLLCKGIGGKFYDLLKHMYSNTLYCCKSEGYINEPFQANLGVKQGDSLSPILFNIFVDDICSYFNNSLADPVLLNNIHFNHFLYADDLVLISETPSGLQHCVDALQSFCSEWSLTVNTNKTKTMIISNNKNRSCIDRHCFYFGPNQLESCTEYKYLGVIFNNKGKLNNSAENLSEKAPQCIFLFKINNTLLQFHFS